MLKKVAPCLVLMASTLLLAQRALATDESIVDKTVCELYSSDQSITGEKVRIKATAYMIVRHGAMLGDKSCSPGSKIGLRFAEDIKTGSTAYTFRKALIGDVMKIYMRIFDVQAIGTYSSEPRSLQGTKGFFIIEEVDWFRKHATEP